MGVDLGLDIGHLVAGGRIHDALRQRDEVGIALRVDQAEAGRQDLAPDRVEPAVDLLGVGAQAIDGELLAVLQHRAALVAKGDHAIRLERIDLRRASATAARDQRGGCDHGHAEAAFQFLGENTLHDDQLRDKNSFGEGGGGPAEPVPHAIPGRVARRRLDPDLSGARRIQGTQHREQFVGGSRWVARLGLPFPGQSGRRLGA
mmetsp:Transcript_17031/g.40628  ORF Transcript_17031/g.40628 Transcript_17031/m.40628 type:complete len:203 (+) Transcript_17031:829-1437(+)